MSRVVLKITGFYELGVFGEDESEDFNKKNTSANQIDDNKQPQQTTSKPTQTTPQKTTAKEKKPLSDSNYKDALKSDKLDLLTKALTTRALTPDQIIGISKRIEGLKKKK